MDSKINSAPRPKGLVADPGLWRPLQYEDKVRSEEALWLDRGECMDPVLLNIVVEELKNIPAHAVFAYPTPGPLYRALADHLDVLADCLMLTRGSDGAIKMVFETFVEEGDTVLLLDPTYQMYAVYSQLFGAKVEFVKYKAVDGRPVIDSREIVKRINELKPRLVGIPNPDNPTGFAFSQNEIEVIVKAANQAGSVFLIDEAYYPFSNQTALPFTQSYQNVVVARTFSKAWGMAGIRLGYTVSNPEITANFNKVRTMVEADGISMALAERMLQRPGDIERSIERLIEGRKYFAAEVNKMGFFALETAGNFIHVDFGDKRKDVEALLAGKVLFRVFPTPPLEQFLRFTTTTIERFEPVVALLKTAAPASRPG